MTTNWVPATPTATITSAGVIPMSAFDASYDPSWNDCPQPGTTQKLDGIGGVLTFRSQWKSWAGYNTVVLNWGVKISATQRSIKWCELRQNQSTGVWSLYQEGIYTPDASTRWLGSIAMDNNGSIGLCYLKSNSSSIYPSLAYAGRRSCDPLGTLPIAEVVAIAGGGSQIGINRDGDYSQTWLDPDGITFWHTGLYLGAGGAAQTRIYSFQIAPCAAVVPVANFSGTPTTICAGSSVTYTDLSTNTPTSWAWTFPGGTPATSTLQNYSVTLTATNGAGSSTPVTMTNYITVNAIPSAPVATNTGPFCAGSTINLLASTVAGATYSWTGPSAFTSTLQNPTRPAATAAMAGTYSVTATVAGCTSTAGTTTVVVNPTPTVTVPANITVCAGQNVATTAFTSSPAGGTFTWTNSNTAIGLAASGSGNVPAFTATNPGATAITGAIIVTATVAGCNSSPTTYTITVNPTPATPVATNTGPFCAGSTINLFSSTVTGATYSWTGPSAYTAAVQNPTRPGATAAMAGVYSVTATVGGCTSSAGTTTVVVNPIPATPTATNTGPYCAGSTITLNTPTVAGATYSWTGPSAFTSTLQNPTRPGATAAMAGTYSVTVTTSGCTSLAGTTTVTVNPTPAVNAETNVTVCNGAPVGANTFTSTPAGATYTWTNSDPTIGLAASGTTSLPAFTATNVTASPVVAIIMVTPTLAGCVGSPLTFTITVNPTPIATFTPSANQCLVGNSFNFTNTGSSGAGYTYSWTFTGGAPASSTTNNPSGITFATAGTHNIIHTITSTAGCIASTSVLVTVFANPTALAVTTTPSGCAAATGTITIGTVTGGTGPFTYSVNGSGFTGTTSYTSFAAGTYSVVVKDVNGCTFTTSAIVGSSSGPTALATTTVNSTCGSPNGVINIGTVTGGTGPFTYSVNASPYTSTTSYTGLAAGTYTVIVKDAGGCLFTTSATIVNSSGPTALAVTSTNSTCGGSNGTATIGIVTGGTAAYTYSFNGSPFTSITSYTGLLAGTYTVIVKDANGCTFTTTVTVGNTGSTPATPTISQAGLTLTSSSATGNQWYLNGILIPGATGTTYTATANGTYTVVVTTGGCSSATSAPVVIINVGIDESLNPYMFSIRR